MRKTHTMLVLTIVFSVFLMSFLLGRAMALRDKAKKETPSQIYSGAIVKQSFEKEEEILPAAAKSEKVEKKLPTVEKEKTKEKKKEKEAEKAVERMEFPCGNKVLKEYSQTAVYSETMGDWRAHTGIDYEAEEGTKVICTWDGEVSRVYKDKLWGYTVEITHSGNIKSVYKNLDKKIDVSEGEKVVKGQAIGKVGKSAAVESREKAHLHFEVWQDGVGINPISYVY